MTTISGITGRLMLFDGPGKPFRLEKQPLQALQPGEVLIRTVYTTICGSDLHTYCGLREEPCPTVLGHEIVGEIVELHPAHEGTDLQGETLQPGDRITWTIFASDPLSANSLRGMPQKGEGLFKYGHARVSPQDAFHGGLAEYCVLKAHTGIIKLPENMPAAVAATLNCSVSTVAGALRMAGDVKGKNVLVTGMGHLGITCAAMCREAGAAWIAAADISEKRLEEAPHFGASECFNMKDDNAALLGALRERTNGNGIDVVFDMSGSPDAMEFGLAALGIGGCAVWIGAVFNTRPLQIAPEKVIRGLLTIKGLHNYNFDDFRYAFGFMQRNWQKYPFGSVVEKEFRLEEVKGAFEYAIAEKPLRVGIKF
ncbi:zinc-binding dehydrogenase [Chitinophaga sp. GCM10012297]|uniref:Zinc-binding dehydrogenase n=1 Tax=Chitinophaga chungangae TaxID=2821488 RepID=A0ABS3Y9J5_9BACT|nr:zinc-binding dehydrogenase [Chitinophaga chungangae]MBO9151321.1 zinc-binding dehydrogenase [Chitinophaga chungangae]